MENFLKMSDLTVTEVYRLIELAGEFKKGNFKPIKEQIFISNLFFEPSTRTKCSFEIAERKLGLDMLNFETENSSVKKGETLYDTIKTLEAIGVQMAVIRHEEDEYFKDLVSKTSVKIINAGDGCGNHPTQCLLDLVTINEEFGSFQDLKIVIVGDLLHSRVAKSNAYMLEKLGAKVYVSGPKEWHFDGSDNYEYITIDEAVEIADVIMLLRIQHERHESGMSFSKEEYHEKFGLTFEREAKMKKESIIMHPAPVNRDVEIASDLVECERSRIFKQMENGVYARMAVLQTIIEENCLGGDKHVTSKKWKAM